MLPPQHRLVCTAVAVEKQLPGRDGCNLCRGLTVSTYRPVVVRIGLGQVGWSAAGILRLHGSGALSLGPDLTSQDTKTSWCFGANAE